MKLRTWVCTIIVAALAVTATACGANTRDLEGVDIKNPDKVEIYVNLDDHPNIVRLCIGGVAFYTTSRTQGHFMDRVPEWDAWCKGTAQ